MNFSKLPTYIILEAEITVYKYISFYYFLIEVANYDVLVSGIQQVDSDLFLYI